MSPDPKPHPLARYQFPPGTSGNPGGRPKGQSLTKLLRELLDGDTLGNLKAKPGETIAHVLAQAAILEACKGNSPYFGQIITRLEGRIPLAVHAQHSGEVTIRVEYAETLTDVDDDHADVAPAAQGPEADPPRDEAV